MASVTVTLVPHGFEVDLYLDSAESPAARYCFDFGDDYEPNALARSVAEHIVTRLREESRSLFPAPLSGGPDRGVSCG